MLKRHITVGFVIAALLMSQAVAITDLVQTFPTISLGGSNGAQAGCTTLTANPGSIIAGTSGAMLVGCDNGSPAVILGGTETPSFILATGYDILAIVLHGSSSKYPCGFNFPPIPTDTAPRSGANLTATPYVFSSSPTSTQLLSGGYDYCLHYNNPIGAIGSFTITWTP